MWLRLTESARDGSQSLMRRLAVDAPPPGWLCDCPTAQVRVRVRVRIGVRVRV